MTGQLPTMHGRGIARSRLLAVAVLASLMLVTFGFVSPASAAADCPLPGVNKTFAAEITPHSVAAGTLDQDFTLDLCNDSPVTTTQQLGSVNVTPPVGFLAKSINLPGCSTPIGMSGATCGDVVNNPTPPPAKIIQIRNIKLQPALPPANQVSFTLKADVPTTCDTYDWTIKGRQSNNFQGAKNDFTLDTTDSDLKTTVTGCGPTPAPNFTVEFVDADPDVAGVQTHAPDNPTGPGYYHLNAKITNTGTGPGTAALTDKDDTGTIEKMEGCSTTPVGLGSGQASCNVGPVQPSTSVEIPITVKLQTVSGEVQNSNTATVSPGGAGSQDVETSTISKAERECADGQDCNRFWYEPSLGVQNLCTGTVNDTNILAACITIPPNATATDGGQRLLTEAFINGGCGGRPCDGTSEEGNMIGWGVAPLACGTATQRLCDAVYTIIPSAIPGFDGTAQTALLLSQGYYMLDDGSGMVATSPCAQTLAGFCERSRQANGNVYTVVNAVPAGDGFTGSCLAKICP